MIDWLLVARANRYGLTADTEIVAEAIRQAGGSCETASTRARGWLDRLLGRKRTRTIIHFERAFPRWFTAGEKNFLIPNQERFPARHIKRLRRVDRVLAKTLHAESIFSEMGVETEWIGFTSRDRRDESVARNWDRFLHLAGGSTLKGTEVVLDLWRAHPEWPELVLVQKAENAPTEVPANVTLVSGYVDDGELKRLQNECGIHLCPSRAEGWGHNIVEALSVGALAIVTNGPPMNELADADCALMVAWDRSEPRHLGTCFHVERGALEAAIETAIAMPEAEKLRISAAAGARYEEIDKGFRSRIARLVAGGRR
ncbi:MAG: glycosyltransferase [Mesorhizobium sp.]|nr:glycosyltransferase [Mesorhizobium sp.]